MLVSRIIGNCPVCGAINSYGNVAVGDHAILRGCTKCDFSERIPLPKIRKKIIYLDQFFYSRAFLLRDRKHDKKYDDAIIKIRELANQQLIVSPFSSIHSDEAYQWRGKDGKSEKDLMDFIKTASHGYEFDPHYSVKRKQVLKSFETFKSNILPSLSVEQSDAITDKIHDWADYLWIDVGGYFGDSDALRESKDAAVSELMLVFDSWSKSNRTFTQQIELEYRSAAKAYLQQFDEYVLLLSRGDPLAHLNASLDSMVVEEMMFSFSEDIEYNQRVEVVLKFFASEHFRLTPYEWISVRIFALLMERVRRGDYKNREKAKRRLKGIFQDVSHIATYAPYSDAIYIDKAMAALLRDNRINLEKNFGTLVFSEENWSEFISYLTSLGSDITPEHKAALKLAYPKSRSQFMTQFQNKAELE